MPAHHRFRQRTPAQWFCLLVGVLLAGRGAEQLVVGASFAMPGEGWRATLQVLTGILLLVAQRDRTAAHWALVPFAILYVLLAVVGDSNGHEAFGLITVDARDRFVNPLYALTALLILGLGARRYSRERDRPRG